MDTRQLAAFCAVVERSSFSQAAEHLGVTQPAVSLQVRALEKRLGTQLLDRSGRRVEPTEAGMRLYRGAQRLLALEEQVLDEVVSEAVGDVAGLLSIGASTGPAAVVVPQLLCEFQSGHPAVRVALEVHDTRTVVELVAERRLELGIVGAAPRHRAVRFEPFAHDEVVLVCPPGHRFAGRSVDVHELASETLVVMQEGAGVRRVVEDELRRLGLRLRDLDVRLELGLQESVRSAVLAGYGVTFISRAAVESELASGALAAARIEGMDGKREISIARGTGRSQTRVADAFATFARERAASVGRELGLLPAGKTVPEG
jgi:DNA-binding transcriptional LysR family regulator